MYFEEDTALLAARGDSPDACIQRPQHQDTDRTTTEFLRGSERLSSTDTDTDDAAADPSASAGVRNDVDVETKSDTTNWDLSSTPNRIDVPPQKKMTSANQNVSPNNRASRSVAPPTRPLPNKTESSSSNNSNYDTSNTGKNAFDAFGEYISFFFQRAEVYEHELERRESRKDVLDKFRHGTLSARLLTPILTEEEELLVDSEGNSINDTMNRVRDDDFQALDMDDDVRASTPILSDTLEALAAVEAMSSFRELKDVKLQLRHSFRCEDDDLESKRQRVLDEAAPETSMEDWKEQWKRFVVEKKKSKFDEVAIQDISLPMSVDEFYNHVIADNATHSFGKFMRGIGEKRVDTTPWQPTHTPTTSDPACRTIHYTHPITAPLAPPMAKALKKQILHKFGNVGLCLETCTDVEDVPMADCFVVEDRLWVHASEDNNEECVVSVTFRIRFVKGTLFRRIIENATRKEYGMFWDQFANMIRILKSPVSFNGEELQKVAIELEHATELLLESEGQEVHMPSVLRSSICTLSRRLSLATNIPSSRKLMHLEGNEEELTEGAVPYAIRVMEHTRGMISNAGLSFVLVCLLCFFMCYLNFMATRQMRMMNTMMQRLDARLDEMIEKLESENHSIADQTCFLSKSR